MNLDRLTALADPEVQRVIASLPPEVSEAISDIPIFLEAVPSEEDVEHLGIEPDTLGLFDEGVSDIPTPRIRLWLENIFDFAEDDPQIFVEEVRITLLHEIGHCVGWDEEDVERRGLE